MAVTTWAPTDFCGFLAYEKECDGTLTDPDNPIAVCGLTKVQEDVTVTDEVTYSGGSPQTSKPCNKRTVPAQFDKMNLILTQCETTNPLFQVATGLYDPLFDNDGNYRGVTRITRQTSTCGECGGATNCTKELALLTWSLAWCGEDIHPDYNFELRWYPRVEFSIATSRTVESGTFTPNELSLRVKNPRNPIMPPVGFGDLADVNALVNGVAEWTSNDPFPGGCCTSCTDEAAIQPAAPLVPVP